MNKWEYRLKCDSCDYETELNPEKWKEADKHEKNNLDHWVQQIKKELSNE
jgi:hypothetical protein